jgi:hypothetical protein
MIIHSHIHYNTKINHMISYTICDKISIIKVRNMEERIFGQLGNLHNYTITFYQKDSFKFNYAL